MCVDINSVHRVHGAKGGHSYSFKDRRNTVLGQLVVEEVVQDL